MENWRVALRDDDFSELMEDLEYMDGFYPSSITSDTPLNPSNMNKAHLQDIGLMGVDIITGADQERGFYDHLECETAVGVTEFDYERAFEDPQVKAVNAADLLSYEEDDETDLARTMVEVLGRAIFIGDIESDLADVGDESDGMRVSLREVDYTPGYVLHGGHLTIATTEEMLERVVQLQNGEARSLAEDEEYLRAIGQLGVDQYIQVYLDLQSLVEIGNIDESDLTRSQVRFLRQTLGSLPVVSTSDDNHERLQVSPTLIPDDD